MNTLNAIFRETIELIAAARDVMWRLQRDWVRYFWAAVAIRQQVTNFMSTRGIPGMSVAIAYKGRLVFSKGYGFADTSTKDPVTTNHLFRIASLSKAITAVAVFRLLQERRLSAQVGTGLGEGLMVPVLRLDEKVFGPGSILGNTYGTPPTGWAPSMMDQITVQHLLEHTSGWSNEQPQKKLDIMFDQPTLDQDALITFMVANWKLTWQPGTIYEYLNFGYCVLGRVIEVRSGMPYADYVRQSVLTPCGISNMHIAGNTLADRRPDEVHYYPGPASSDFRTPYALLVDRMDAHGGWIASASDLVRFLVHVDNFPTSPPDILAASSIRTMVTPTTAKAFGGATANYGKGWGVMSTAIAGEVNYFHEGNLTGTEAYFVRTPDQYCFAVLANSRHDVSPLTMYEKLWWQDIKPGVERGRHPDRVWPTGTPL
jgi:CubicO group peptidase (beta-lactamase class C family)